MDARLLAMVFAYSWRAACDAAGPSSLSSFKEDRRLASIVIDRAESDAEAALSRGDTRLIGVFGIARDVPGAPDGTAYQEGACGVRMIEETSDDGSPELNARARAYAKRYNLLILSRADCFRLPPA